MKHRPQVQLRFRDEWQYFEAKKRAAEAGLSLNEYLVRLIGNGEVEAKGEGSTTKAAEPKTQERRPAGGVKMKVEEFMGLSAAEKQRAIREGRYAHCRER